MRALSRTVSVFASIGLAGLIAGAPTASAGRPDQLLLRGVAPGFITTGDRDAAAALIREPDTEMNVFAAGVFCAGSGVRISSLLGSPEKVLDTPRKIQVDQTQNLSIAFESDTTGRAEAVVPSCGGRVTAVDKDRNGELSEGTDQLSFSLSCGADLSTVLGLSPEQTAELAAAFPKKVQCSGKGTVDSCFRGDTLVSTEQGPRPIRDVRVGDRVWSWDEEEKRAVLRRVSRLYRKPAGSLRVLRVGTETIYTTDEHPYWVGAKGWTRAADLAEGDALRTQAGGRLTLVANEVVSPDRFYAGYRDRASVRPASFGTWSGRQVYNLEVEDTHTFYVGEQRILVHNK